jgi:HEAT repeat protein
MASPERFALGVKELLAGDHRIAAAHLHWFSDLDPSQTRRFRDAFAGLPVEARRRLLEQLVEAAEDNFELDFQAIGHAALDDEDGEVRRLGIEALWESKEASVAERLLRLLQEDAHAPVRAQAATSLGTFVMLHDFEELKPELGRRIEAALLQVARHNPDLEIRRRAVESMGYSSRPEIPALLRETYAAAQSELKASALLAMGRTADGKLWGPTVLGDLRNPNPAIRFQAVAAAGQLSLKQAVVELVELLNDSDSEIREQAIWSLGEIGGEKARRALERAQRTASASEQQLIDDALDNLEFQGGLDDFRLLEVDPERKEKLN